MTLGERTLRGRIGAYAMHAKHDVMKTSAPGRRAAWDRFEKQVDPEGALEPAERARRAEMARREHFARMGLASAKSRRRKKAVR